MAKRKEKKEKKVLAPTLIRTLGTNETAKLRHYLWYLYSSALHSKNYKSLGCIRGMYNQLCTLSQLVESDGRRLPPKNSRRKKVAQGQLGLFEESG
jgi:hypothetical protein